MEHQAGYPEELKKADDFLWNYPKICPYEIGSNNYTAFYDLYERKFWEYWDLFQQFKRNRNESKVSLTDVMFITVNPAPDIGLPRFQQIIEKFCHKNLITNYIYVLEQRGLTEDVAGTGFHAHILITHGYSKPSLFTRETQSSFKSVCQSKNFHILNIKPCNTAIDVEKRINYMLNQKKDEDGLNKEQKQSIDKIWREDKGLLNVYSNDIELWNNYLG